MKLSLNALMQGNGPPLIILHGLFGSSRNWGAIAQRLAEHWTVHALDLRNHGQSPWSDDVRYQALAADVQGYLDDQKIGRAAIIGHSMGGKAAMALALSDPARVERLLVADIAPVRYPPAFQPYLDAMRSLDLSNIARRNEADAHLTDAVPDAGIRAFLLQNLASGPDGLAWRMNLAALDAGMEEIQGFPDDLLGNRFGGSTLFLSGGRSDYVRPAHRDTIKQSFPKARFARIPDAGHWVHAEKPAEFFQTASIFLKS